MWRPSSVLAVDAVPECPRCHSEERPRRGIWRRGGWHRLAKRSGARPWESDGVAPRPDFVEPCHPPADFVQLVHGRLHVRAMVRLAPANSDGLPSGRTDRLGSLDSGLASAGRGGSIPPFWGPVFGGRGVGPGGVFGCPAVRRSSAEARRAACRDKRLPILDSGSKRAKSGIPVGGTARA